VSSELRPCLSDGPRPGTGTEPPAYAAGYAGSRLGHVVGVAVQRLVDAGATVLHEMDEPIGWYIVMTDPESNEFRVT
jgi:hypothetical protein